jgi:hypothetical protein
MPNLELSTNEYLNIISARTGNTIDLEMFRIENTDVCDFSPATIKEAGAPVAIREALITEQEKTILVGYRHWQEQVTNDPSYLLPQNLVYASKVNQELDTDKVKSKLYQMQSAYDQFFFLLNAAIEGIRDQNDQLNRGAINDDTHEQCITALILGCAPAIQAFLRRVIKVSKSTDDFTTADIFMRDDPIATIKLQDIAPTSDQRMLLGMMREHLESADLDAMQALVETKNSRFIMEAFDRHKLIKKMERLSAASEIFDSIIEAITSTAKHDDLGGQVVAIGAMHAMFDLACMREGDGDDFDFPPQSHLF